MRIRVLSTIILSCMLAVTVAHAGENHQPAAATYAEKNDQPAAATSQAGSTACEMTGSAVDQQQASSSKQESRSNRQKVQRDEPENQQDDPGAAFMNQVELRS
jgi:hypothetical protein